MASKRATTSDYFRHHAADPAYQALGFVPFGPLVGSGDAQFQPM